MYVANVFWHTVTTSLWWDSVNLTDTQEKSKISGKILRASNLKQSVSILSPLVSCFWATNTFESPMPTIIRASLWRIRKCGRYSQECQHDNLEEHACKLIKIGLSELGGRHLSPLAGHNHRKVIATVRRACQWGADRTCFEARILKLPTSPGESGSQRTI
jgi:hypothetical protein